VLPDGVAAMGYDAARILIEALKTAKDLSSIEIRNTLALTKNHDGVTGKITFNEDRDPVKPIVVLKINGRKAQFVKRIEP
jgi:branched-chain amino acid transport system substrate-binding protein